ncbi:MAG: hypothetical protein C0443_02715 [Comamonadaceae bacterium]|nr:hypothetical protein [Comamonadaceae bacterium]
MSTRSLPHRPQPQGLDKAATLPATVPVRKTPTQRSPAVQSPSGVPMTQGRQASTDRSARCAAAPARAAIPTACGASSPDPMPTPKAPRSDGAATQPALRCQLCAARMSCLIGQLPRSRLERLAPLIREVAFHKGEWLQKEGVGVEGVRAIKLGTLMLTRNGPDSAARPVALVGRGHLLGQWGLLDQRTATGVQALSSGRVCELPVTALRGAGLQDPVFLHALHTSMAHGFARLADWSQVMRLRGLKRQLVATLMLLGEAQGLAVVRLPSQVALAALLNTSRESVARTLRQIEADGFLRRIDRWHAELSRSHRAVFDEATRKPGG